jgi:hypothetical protein
MALPNMQLPQKMDFTIPRDLFEEFRQEVRIVLRYPWVIGIPVPYHLLKNPELFNKVKGYELMLVPSEMTG